MRGVAFAFGSILFEEEVSQFPQQLASIRHSDLHRLVAESNDDFSFVVVHKLSHQQTSTRLPAALTTD